MNLKAENIKIRVKPLNNIAAHQTTDVIDAFLENALKKFDDFTYVKLFKKFVQALYEY